MSNKDMPVYPGTVLESRRDPESGGIGQEYVIAPGLTKLEAFTMAALQGLCANPNMSNWDPTEYAWHALNVAKAALDALEREQ